MQQQKPVQRQQYGCLGMVGRMILDAVIFRFVTKRILNWLNNRSRAAHR
jgi:hypothetical protein